MTIGTLDDGEKMLIACIDAVDDLDDWERQFIESMQERYDQYGEDTFVSEKQAKKLGEIYKKILS